jgi:hypothetical protein
MEAETHHRPTVVIFVHDNDVAASIVASTDREQAAAEPLLEKIQPALQQLRQLVEAD